MLSYYVDPELRQRHGRNARGHVPAHFDRREQARKMQTIVEARAGASKGAGSAMKRTFDVFVACAFLLVLSPVIGVIALAIKLNDGGPVIYTQERIGLKGQPFPCHKFRTMIVGAASTGLGHEVAQDDERITAVGKVLRQWTLDEIPQLLNVLRGEMSVVGPRPAIQEQVDRYDEHQRRRLEVRPGLAGWAWIQGRNSLPWSERIELDVWYVENWSFGLDVRILARAFLTLVKRDGVYGVDGVVRDLD